ncbi:MAG: hypothetical protein ISR65_07330 [Bacteriovoracaceae bacterium]|nr:hypothetical protein [Bacteriovoracaceae bacterium]
MDALCRVAKHTGMLVGTLENFFTNMNQPTYDFASQSRCIQDFSMPGGYNDFCNQVLVVKRG